MSWVCSDCGERSESGFDVCWKCGTGMDGSLPAPDFVSDVDARVADARQLECLRCNTQMKFEGRKRFHEGTRVWPLVLAELGELFVKREAFDVYACPSCGKVEFFVEPRAGEG